MNGSQYDELIRLTAAKYNLDPGRFRRQLVAESGLNPNIVNQKSGAAGIAQFMPATARGIGINPLDPNQAIPAAGQLMRTHLNNFANDYPTALAAYNWGPGNVQRKGMANAPAETRGYIAKIMHGGQEDPPMMPTPVAEQYGPPAPSPRPQVQAQGLDPRLLLLEDQPPSLGDIIASASRKSMV